MYILQYFFIKSLRTRERRRLISELRKAKKRKTADSTLRTRERRRLVSDLRQAKEQRTAKAHFTTQNPYFKILTKKALLMILVYNSFYYERNFCKNTWT